MESYIYKRATRNLELLIAIPVGLCFGYLLINLLMSGLGQRLFKPGWLPIAIVVFTVGVIGIILIRRLSRGKINFKSIGSGVLSVEISFPSGETESWKGELSCLPMHSETYARYGMYRKSLALSIACDDIPICLLRHELGGMQSAPKEFTLLHRLLNPGGVEYWCKDVIKIYRYIEEFRAA